MKSNAGMTLMELMITVAIVALLASIAYPSYREQVLKSHRSDAKAALMQAAQAMERCYTRTNSFADAACTGLVVAAVPGGRYQLSVAAPNATTYTLTATAQGPQTADTRCGDLTLRQDGTKGRSGSAPVADCW